MKQKTKAVIGTVVTVALMVALAYSVFVYSQNPSDGVGLAAMSMLSTGMMVFLVIFAVLYTKSSPSDDYMEIYQGLCSRCGSRFGDDGVCPNCGRVQPSKPGR